MIENISNTPELSEKQVFPILGRLSFIPGSFLLIHVLGIIGIFLSLAYPLWWFFMPAKTLCLYCYHLRFLNPNSVCPVCKRSVQIARNPPLFSVFINMSTLLLFSLLSSGIIMGEIAIISKLEIPFFEIKQKPTLVSIPTKNTYKLGEEFTINIEINNLTQPINVVHADLKFDPAKFQLKEITTSKSFATIFVQKEYSNTKGWISIVGGLPSPGYIGEKGILAQLTFVPLSEGLSQLQFLDSSVVLANDGKGSKVTYQFTPSNVVVEK
jgi:hypothetical protein